MGRSVTVMIVFVWLGRNYTIPWICKAWYRTSKPITSPSGIADLLDPGVAELLDIATRGADQVVVLAEGMCFLELGMGAVEAMPAHEVAIHQQVHGIVKVARLTRYFFSFMRP